MRIKDMFTKDLDRDINGVVKVAQEDDAATKQELEEYVVTRELKRRFGDFFSAYEAALDRPTDKIGVWISGFFGSGKSHFLKMISHLLSSRVVDGRPAVDYFIDPATGESKFGDPLMDAQIRRCVAVPTESILFNIANKSPDEKDKTAILKVFARVFYEHLGYYGEYLRLARLERYIDEQGKRDAFREAFERVNGGSWLEERETYDFISDDVIEALAESGVMSHDEATRWAEGTDTSTLSIDTLTNEIRDYAERRAAEEGGQFRLLFCVDEVGQYIGSDVSLMLNLQTLVEELGTKCGGRVWVLVTSQEAIDEVTKVAGNDFSKIQGRFDTRLSLSSSSVDEVIKRRVLEKTQVARETLSLEYEQKASVLKNLFTFEDARSDLIGYGDSEEFITSYPFVGYQFKVMQDVFTEIRKHGSSGKHLSSGERSMLSGFQEAAQAVEDLEEGALVPFSSFYDTVHTFLEGAIRRVIDTAQDAADKGQGLEQQDVPVLKLLFLIRYIDDIKANVSNIAILMTRNIDEDKVALRDQVAASLERLVRENYVSRSGDVYTFLTDEEQDIARQIRDTRVDEAQITRKIASVVFGDVFPDKKFRVGSGDTANDFPVDRFVDETAESPVQGGLVLRIITALSPVGSEDYQQLTLRSSQGEAICVLKGSEYYDALEEAARIERYVSTQNVRALPLTVQVIIENRVKEQRSLERQAAELLKHAIVDADFYVAGSGFSPHAAGAKARLGEALGELVGSVYTKLSYIDHNVRDDAEVLAIARGGVQAFDGLQANARACDEVARYLQGQRLRNLAVTMKGIQVQFGAKPYGWREVDVAAVVAALVAGQRAQVRYGGAVVSPQDAKFADLLRQRTKIASVQVEPRVAVSEEQRSRVRKLLVDMFRGESIPLDEDGLCAAAARLLGKLRDEVQRLLDTEYRRSGYPGRLTLEHGIKLIDSLLTRTNDPAELIGALRRDEDDLLDFSEDYEDVKGFFAGGHRELFDRARSALDLMDESERGYFAGDEDMAQSLDTVGEIVSLDEPYSRLRELPELVGTIEKKHGELLARRRREVLDEIASTFAEIERAAEEQGVAIGGVGRQRDGLEGVAHSAKTLANLDAARLQLDHLREQDYLAIERQVKEKQRPKPGVEGVTVTTHAGTFSHRSGASGGSRPQSAEPKRETRSVRLTKLLARPRLLSSESEIDTFLGDLRKRLVEELEAADGADIFVS